MEALAGVPMRAVAAGGWHSASISGEGLGAGVGGAGWGWLPHVVLGRAGAGARARCPRALGRCRGVRAVP